MYKIGITGSIGMGKTTIAKLFTIFGIPVHSSDYEVSKILRQKKTIELIKNKWPRSVVNNKLDKNYLRKKVFTSKPNRKYLESLIHPLVNKRKLSFEKKNKNKKILVYDVPLIYETNSQKNYDLIILANCPYYIQKRRVLDRKIYDENMFKKIKESQLSTENKLKYNPVVLDTSLPKFITFLKISFLLLRIKICK